MKHWRLVVLFLAALTLALPEAAEAQRGGGKKGSKNSGTTVMSPMHPAPPRDLRERAGLIKTGLRPAYPQNAECLEVKSFFGDQTRYDGSFRVEWANHGYHAGVDISAPIGTPVVAIAKGEVVHKYEGGRLVGKQIILRHTPDDTGLAMWVYSKYKHFDEMPGFEIGDRVKMGQFLGPSGDSGTAGGHFPAGYSHLHLSIYTSMSPDYRNRKKAVVPKDVRQLDPVAIYLTKTPPIVDSHSARDLPDAEKDVPIPYMTTDGKTVPEGTRLIWPFKCKPR